MPTKLNDDSSLLSMCLEAVVPHANDGFGVERGYFMIDECFETCFLGVDDIIVNAESKPKVIANSQWDTGPPIYPKVAINVFPVFVKFLPVCSIKTVPKMFYRRIIRDFWSALLQSPGEILKSRPLPLIDKFFGFQGILHVCHPIFFVLYAIYVFPFLLVLV